MLKDYTTDVKVTNPKDNINLLTLYKIGLQCGVLDAKTLVEIADKIILKEDHPHHLFIAGSLIKKLEARFPTKTKK